MMSLRAKRSNPKPLRLLRFARNDMAAFIYVRLLNLPREGGSEYVNPVKLK